MTARFGTVRALVLRTCSTMLVGRAIDCRVGKLALTIRTLKVPFGSCAPWLVPPPHPLTSRPAVAVNTALSATDRAMWK